VSRHNFRVADHPWLNLEHLAYFALRNGVLCISEHPANIYIKYMYNAKAYSAASATSRLASATITRRDPTEHDILIEILYCGICHSNLH